MFAEPADSIAASADGIAPSAPGDLPSLVVDVQGSAQPTREPWTKKQKRLYQRLLSWITQKSADGCQLLRVDLTSADHSESRLLRRHFQELRRRLSRRYGYKVDAFIVETCEGNGVLHMVWSVDEKRAVWIEQGWLAEEWEKIHGARVTWIKRMKTGKYDRRRVTSYLVSQYLVNQGDSGSALVRYSYSWWHCRVTLGKGWQSIKRQFRFCEYRYRRVERRGYGSAPPIVFADLLRAWNELLTVGRAVLGDVALTVYDREVVTVAEAAQRIFA